MKVDAPLSLHTETVLPEWIDYNGHMNLAYYVLIFDHATEAFLDFIGMTEKFRKDNQSSTFAAELHVTYEKEVKLDDVVLVKTHLLDFDDKRIHYFHYMYHVANDKLVATNELISLYMNMDERRVGSMPGSIQYKLQQILDIHCDLPLPEQCGSRIGLRRKS